MFKWFNKNKNEKPSNYTITSNNEIEIKIFDAASWAVWETLLIPVSSVISYNEERIIFEDADISYSHYTEYCGLRHIEQCRNHAKAIDKKENFIECKETWVKTFKYNPEEQWWKLVTQSKIKVEEISNRTPLEIFKEEYKSKYKLIETEEEFNDYLSSALDCDTWCRKKLYDKMRELGLGDGFINQFADLVGNDLDKYYAMIDLANEVYDKDTLMYLYTYKFGKK
jgi:hypothetical protein